MNSVGDRIAFRNVGILLLRIRQREVIERPSAGRVLVEPFLQGTGLHQSARITSIVIPGCNSKRLRLRRMMLAREVDAIHGLVRPAPNKQ